MLKIPLLSYLLSQIYDPEGESQVLIPVPNKFMENNNNFKKKKSFFGLIITANLF